MSEKRSLDAQLEELREIRQARKPGTGLGSGLMDERNRRLDAAIRTIEWFKANEEFIRLIFSHRVAVEQLAVTLEERRARADANDRAT